MPVIRRAQPDDSEALTGIAVRSEAHWGYGSEFMAAFREIYQVTGEFIARNPTFAVEENGLLIGFYALVQSSLEYMYLDPAHMGKGLGRFLWDHMTAFCGQNGIQEIPLVCGPEPKAFYLKMGAVEAGETDSLVVPGRKVSTLRYRFESLS
jgi:GNAT superfamily N-acetyltransferase